MFKSLAAVSFLLLLLAVLFYNGTLSYKGFCGNDFVHSQVKCACAGLISAVVNKSYNDYYCTGVNFSYNKIFESFSFIDETSAYFQNNKESIRQLPKDLQVCTVDKDCILEKNTCRCGCEDVYGTDYDLSINKKYDAQWRTTLACPVKRDPASKCPAINCPVAKAICVDNICKDISIAINK